METGEALMGMPLTLLDSGISNMFLTCHYYVAGIDICSACMSESTVSCVIAEILH